MSRGAKEESVWVVRRSGGMYLSVIANRRVAVGVWEAKDRKMDEVIIGKSHV